MWRMADGYLNFDTKINEKGFNDGISKLGSLGKSGLSIVSKAMTGAIAAVGTGAAAIIKSSLGVVANMEQQVGGVETLFKDSANTVIANANKAYKTAGMSANNYMETVTSFSASLLQSLGGDTAKAASYADRAIVDMSDNANKMGTNMRDIQNAYQGFAKQNYTMLDNLKLGYGGTQEEMKRLISDASKMTDVQKELGVTVDASSLSFGNIVNAISVVQKQMGITGTTSKEAATTIEGSVNSAKYAYAYSAYLDNEKSTKTSLTLNRIKATGHGRKCILMCFGAMKVTTLTARLSVYVNGKESCFGITSSTSYVPVFDSNIITLPEGENTIELRLSAQANTATAYIGRYHKLGFIVAEL